MGSVRSYLQLQARIGQANISKPITSRATYATVSNPPLDQKVEMTNWEKVSRKTKNWQRIFVLTCGRVTTLTTSKDEQDSATEKERG